jgi:hypothetical protein
MAEDYPFRPGRIQLRDRLDAVAVEVGDVWLEKIVITPPTSKGDARGIGVLPAPVTDEIQKLIASHARRRCWCSLTTRIT